MSKIRLLPVEEDCWEVITKVCKDFNTTPMTIIKALMSKSEYGEFTRVVVSKRFEDKKNEENLKDLEK